MDNVNNAACILIRIAWLQANKLPMPTTNITEAGTQQNGKQICPAGEVFCRTQVTWQTKSRHDHHAFHELCLVPDAFPLDGSLVSNTSITEHVGQAVRRHLAKPH